MQGKIEKEKRNNLIRYFNKTFYEFRLYLMKEMYNNYDEEEEDWDKPEVNMLYTWVHSLSPFFKQKKLEISGVFTFE